jgi:hypothetical protein
MIKKRNITLIIGIVIIAIYYLGVFWHSRSMFALILSGDDIRKGILGYWTMDRDDQETSGLYRIFDRSGNNINITQRQNVPVSLQAATSTSGHIKEGVYLSNGNYLYVETSDNLSTTDFSLAIWVKIPSTQELTASSTNPIISKWNGSLSTAYPFLLEVTNATYGVAADRGKVVASRYDLTNRPFVTSTITINDNKWHHLVFQKNGSNLEFYTDGQINDVQTDTISGSATNSWTFEIGKMAQVKVNMLNGSVDDFRVYTRALSAAEVKKIYQMKASAVSKTPATFGTMVNKSGLVGWWTFDVGTTSTIANDRSGFGNNGISSPAGAWGAAGKLGQGMYFNGTSGTIRVAAGNSLDITSIGIGGWARSEYFDRGSIISKGSYAIKVGADRVPYAEIVGSTTSSFEAGSLGGTVTIHQLIVYKGQLYAATGNDSGIIYRYDGGTTWTNVGQPGSYARATSLAIYNGKLYAGTRTPSSWGRVYRYEGDSTWTDVVGTELSGGIRKLAAINNTLYAFALGTDDIYRYDGGTTWTVICSFLACPPTYAVASHNGKLYQGGYGSNVYRLNGSTWSSIGQPYNASQVWSLASYNGRLFAGNGTSLDVSYYNEGTGSWTWAGTPGTGNYVMSLVVYNGELYAAIGNSAGANLYVYKGGTSWADVGLRTGAPILSMAVYDGKLYTGSGQAGAISDEGNSGDGKIYAFGTGAAIYASSTVLGAGFNHLFSTYNGSSLKFYLNGILVASSSTSFTASTTAGSLYIGGSAGSSGEGDGGESFNGTLDDVRIYNRVLSAKEIRDLYAASAGNVVGKTPNTTGTYFNAAKNNGLVAWWTFDGKDMTSAGATDKTGNGNTGARTSIGTSPMAGRLGQALWFDGATGTVRVADSNSLDITNNFTLSAWIRRSEMSKVRSIVSKGSYALKIGADDRPYFEMANGTAGSQDTGAAGTSTRIYSFAVFKGKLYAGAYTSAQVFRYDGGTTWTSVGWLPNGAAAYSLVVYNGNLYATVSAVSNANVYRYDGGTTWTSVGQLGTLATIVTSIVYKNNLYAGGTGTTFYRYDGGTTWTSVGTLSGQAYSTAVYKEDLYVGNSTGEVQRYDGGTTWTGVGTPAASIIMSLVVYDGNLYAAPFGTGTAYRYDGGTTWTSVGALGNSTGLRTLAVYGGKLYGAGIDTTTPSSLYRYDGGTTWTSMGQFGTTGSSTRALAVYDGKLFAGTWDTGNVYSVGNGTAVYGTSPLNTGFNHLIATYDGSAVKLWLNGKLNTSYATSTSASTTAYAMLIGSSYGSSGASIGEENFEGTIDDARIYNRALSASEIQQLYRTGK